ncbi:MAG: hypothetical protein JXB49_17375 [Bacteroidales bacterium]|nr:hypothetical protein [Bacteroidales bacterium]MBN2862183.1 hypothetical protein [Bacteroidales bacterium]
MQSLLGQFYSRIKGSQENIASEGLVYILQRSKAARQAISNIIKNNCGLKFSDITFEAQSTGKNLERPDITGKDENGKKVLIFEAKFWASLTESQPGAYLKSLSDNSVLIFICPDLRVRPLFNEINSKLAAEKITVQEVSDWHLKVAGSNQHLLVRTWPQILEPVKDHLSQSKEYELLSDINQIIGFCEKIDTTAFLPIINDDLSPKYARRINSYYDVIDKVVEELKKHKRAETKNMRAAGQKYGYGRYFKMGQFGVGFHLRLDYWEKEADTPFWVNYKDEISNVYWSASENLRKATKSVGLQLGYRVYENSYKELFFALPPLLNVTGDEVVNDLAAKIIVVCDSLARHHNS